MIVRVENRRKNLITVDEVVSLTAIESNAPTKHIETSIQIAEERIKSEICTPLYDNFRFMKNVDVTDINKTYLESLFTESVTLEIGDIVNSLVLVSNNFYVDLWEQHLEKVIAEMVIYVASPTNYSRFTSTGEVENNPRVITGEGGNAQSVTLETMQWKMDRLNFDRIAPLIAGLNEYLFTNRAYFPLMNCKKWKYNQAPDGISFERKSAWITGLYDNDTSPNCNTPCRNRDDW